jgi:hypothetical protein
MHIHASNKFSLPKNLQTYSMIQEETLIFSEIIILVIVKKVSYEHVPNLNGYRGRAVSISKPNPFRFFFVVLNEERSYKRKVDTRDELLARISDDATRI